MFLSKNINSVAVANSDKRGMLREKPIEDKKKSLTTICEESVDGKHD
jgi:hypothetical protein